MKKYSLFSSFSWSWSDIYLHIVFIVIVGFFTFCQWPYHNGWTNKMEVNMEIVSSHWIKWCQERCPYFGWWEIRKAKLKIEFEFLFWRSCNPGRNWWWPASVFRENCTLTHRSLGAVTSLSGLFCARRQLWEKWKWFALFLATKDLCLARLLLQSRARDLFTSK